MRDAAFHAAVKRRIDAHWLNEAVKRFVSRQGGFASFLEFGHLRVIAAEPAYLLAKKCVAMRIGMEFNDEDDVRFLLHLLDVHSYEHALCITTKNYPLEHFAQKTLSALEDLLPEGAAKPHPNYRLQRLPS